MTYSSILFFSSLCFLLLCSKCEATCTIDSKADLISHLDAYDLDPSSTTHVCGNISTWDVSRITSFSSLFKNRANFNADISNWDTSSVTDLSATFYGTTSFTGDGVKNWDTSSVTNLFRTFWGASSFTGNGVLHWDISSLPSSVHSATFDGTDSFTDCTKYAIYEAWNSSKIGVMDNFASWASPLSTCTCNVNEHVLDHLCTPCPVGTTNDAGDDPFGSDTICDAISDAIICAVDEYVSSNVCVACPEGRATGIIDDGQKLRHEASGPDTSCDFIKLCTPVLFNEDLASGIRTYRCE